MVTPVAESSKDPIAVMKMSREEQHHLLILNRVNMLTHILGVISN